jgi:hypothetical protein
MVLEHAHRMLNANASSGDMLIGVLLQLTGTTLTVLGLNGQKYGHMWGEEQKEQHGEAPKLSKNWRWGLGFAGFFIGQFTEWAAQGFASQEVCVSLSNVSLVTNAVVASVIFGETFNFKPPKGWCTPKVFFGWDFGATFVILSGTVATVIVAPAFESSDWTLPRLQDAVVGTAFLSYISATVAATFWCIYEICYRLPKEEQMTGKRPSRGGFVYAILSALTGSYVVTLSKIVLLIVKNAFAGDGQGGSEFTEPSTYIFMVLLAVCAVTTLTNLNMGLARFNSLIVLPTYYVFNTILAIFSGMLFYSSYNDFKGKPDNPFNTGYPGNVVCFGCGAVFTLLGVFFLAQREAEAEEGEEDEEGEEGEAEKGDTADDAAATDVRPKRPSILRHRGPVRRRVPIPLLDLAAALHGRSSNEERPKPKAADRWRVVTLTGLASTWYQEFMHASSILCHVPQPGHGGLASPNSAASSSIR